MRLTPRGGREGLEGVASDAEGRSFLRLRVAAAPVDGAANAALIDFLARTLEVRHRDIAIRSGETGRLKIITIAGDGPELGRRLERWIGEAALRG